jgi:predicted nuclease of predicted toxin-antitoxin system
MNCRVLVDECLTPELVPIAHKRGFEAHHVAHRGLSGQPDQVVFETVANEDFLFVTNNREDWCKLLSEVDLHAGLIVIPDCRREVQKMLFGLALAHAIEIGGLENKRLDIDLDGQITVVDLSIVQHNSTSAA